MAAKLQCEICGGKLIGKPGGIFECESCGTEYSTAWAKEKIQEIQGTVKVEGTVDVKGTVQVENPVKVEGTANVQSLIRRGNLALEDRKWDEAEKCFNEALNADPENAEAYLGLVMRKVYCSNIETFTNKYINDNSGIISTIEYKRTLQFSDGALKEWLVELEKKRVTAYSELIERIKSTMARLSPYTVCIAAGDFHTVGLNDDGTVIAVGDNKYGQCDVSNWTDIVAVAAGEFHTVGLRSDGTVLAVGNNAEGQCKVFDWRDIIAIFASYDNTIGVKKDGRIIAIGSNEHKQCEVSCWNNIKAIETAYGHAVGLKTDGTVIGIGLGYREFECISGWKDIVAIAANTSITYGVQFDGKVVVTGEGGYGSRRKDVDSEWKNVVSIAAGRSHTVCLRADGTVFAGQYNNYERHGQNYVSDWKDIVAIKAGRYHTVGLKSDGTVVAVGDNDSGQCNTSNWKLIRTESEKESDYKKASNLEKTDTEVSLEKAVSMFKGLKNYKDSAERVIACERAFNEKKVARLKRERAEESAQREKMRQKKLSALNTEKNNLQTELANLKGLFTGRRRKEIEARLAQIENELKRL